MREPPMLSMMGTCFSVLIRMELARLRDQIIPLGMYLSGADAGTEAIVNQISIILPAPADPPLVSKIGRSRLPLIPWSSKLRPRHHE